MTLDNITNIIQASVAAVTLCATIILAIVASRFNKTQLVKLHAEQIDNLNRTIIDITLANPEAGRLAGHSVLNDSDVLVDYANFTILNTIYFAWEMRKSGVLSEADFIVKINSIAQSFIRYGPIYFEAILNRGYPEAFRKELRQAVNRMGGFTI